MVLTQKLKIKKLFPESLEVVSVSKSCQEGWKTCHVWLAVIDWLTHQKLKSEFIGWSNPGSEKEVRRVKLSIRQ